MRTCCIKINKIKFKNKKRDAVLLGGPEKPESYVNPVTSPVLRDPKGLYVHKRVTRHLFCCWRLPLIKMVSDFSTPWANFVS